MTRTPHRFPSRFSRSSREQSSQMFAKRKRSPSEQRGGLECRPPLFIKAQSGTHRGTEFQSDAGVPVGRHSIVDRYICLSESCGRSIWIGIFYRVKLANDRSITGRKISIKSLNYRSRQSGN